MNHTLCAKCWNALHGRKKLNPCDKCSGSGLKLLMPDFIKNHLHQILKLKERENILYKNVVFSIDEGRVVGGYILSYMADYVIEISKPMKYKQKNNYIKGYNKN